MIFTSSPSGASDDVRACDTPDGFTRLTRGLAANWKPGRRWESAVSQRHAGLHLPPRRGCCDAGEDVFIAV